MEPSLTQILDPTTHPMRWEISDLTAFAAIMHWKPELRPASTAFVSFLYAAFAEETDLVWHSQRDIMQMAIGNVAIVDQAETNPTQPICVESHIRLVATLHVVIDTGTNEHDGSISQKLNRLNDIDSGIPMNYRRHGELRVRRSGELQYGKHILQTHCQFPSVWFCGHSMRNQRETLTRQHCALQGMLPLDQVVCEQVASLSRFWVVQLTLSYDFDHHTCLSGFVFWSRDFHFKTPIDT